MQNIIYSHVHNLFFQLCQDKTMEMETEGAKSTTENVW